MQEALDLSNLLLNIILHFHLQNDARKANWHSPNGHTHNQIDLFELLRGSNQVYTNH